MFYKGKIPMVDIHSLDIHSRDIFGIVVRKNSHKDIRRLKSEMGITTIHGNKFWKSTILLIDYLQVSPPPTNKRILEIGCGWGIGGIYLAKYHNAIITSLDADDSVFPHLQYHADLNGVGVSTIQSRYEDITKKMLSEFDMVIASDVCFWDEMSQPLSDLIDRCYQAGVERVVMTDPGRQPFRDMAEHCAEKYAAIYENWSVPHPYNISGLVLDIR
ncbi:MAG: putative nicotinamide N-methyase [Granulosicoccus sp.]|jgi:predicted nicotinamide N-methyase